MRPPIAASAGAEGSAFGAIALRKPVQAEKKSHHFREISDKKNQRISFVCRAKATYIVIAASWFLEPWQLR